MRNFKIILLLAAMIAGSSCVKEKLEETYNKQEEQIDKYITSAIEKDSTYTVSYNNGSARMTTVAGEGEELSPSGSVSFYYAGYRFSGSISSSNLFETNHEETATGAGWTLTDASYTLMEVNMSEGGLLNGVWNGLVGVKAGEECEILFSAKYAYGNKRFGIIPAKTALAFKIWVVGVSND